MRLIKCYILGFGILKNREYYFNEGLTTFVEDNGKGKTTLTAFIRAMLYGLSDTRKQSLDENPRKKYAPWTGGSFGGSLTIEISGKTYTIERSFGTKASEDTFALRDSLSGALCDAYSINIGEEALGIDEDGFAKTMLFGEGAARSDRHSPSIASRLSDATGSDGDVGDYDMAIKRLDEARKFYHKRGGGGEIFELSKKIQELEAELDEIERCHIKALALEKELADLDRMRKEILAQRRTLEERVKELGKEKERIARERVYRSMLESLEVEKARLGEARARFGEAVPSAEGVEDAKLKWREALRLHNEVRDNEGDDSQYLCRLFAPGTSFEELEDAKKTAQNLEEHKLKLEEIEAKTDEVSKRIVELFPKKRPTKEELDEHITLASAGNNWWVLPFLFGILVAIIGAFTGFMIAEWMYVFVATGVAIMSLGATIGSLNKKKKDESVRAFLLSIGTSAYLDPVATLEGKKWDLVEYERLSAERDKAREGLVALVEKEEATLGDFLARFPLGEGKTISEHIKHLSKEYARFYALSSTKRGESKEEKLASANRLMSEVRTFISRFGITEGDPFAKLKDMLEGYTLQALTVERMQRECEEYRSLYNLKANPREDVADEWVVELIGKTDEKLREIEAEYAVNSKNLSTLMERVEKRGELEARYRALLDKKARYEHTLSLIKRTMDILTEAKDVMCSKYLGKTRERFVYYENLISEGCGEFSVSSSFALTINELGKGRSEESYSRGIRDLYALAMQVALLDAMYPDNPPFLILDDPFIAFDDTRCKRGVALIKKLAEERQILYFTCSKSRAIE